MRRKDVLTTGEVAKICCVAPRTVSKWFDSGQLKGYRIPGSRDRRIPLGQLIKFMKENGIPLTRLSVIEGATRRVLLVTSGNCNIDKALGGAVQADHLQVETAENDFQAGIQSMRFKPHLILLDINNKAVDADKIIKTLRNDPSLAHIRVVALAGQIDSRQRRMLLSKGFDAVLSEPYKPEDILSLFDEIANPVDSE